MNILLYLKKRDNWRPMDIKESLVDHRRKVPQSRIQLYYFAGQCTSRNIYMGYQQLEDKEEVEKMKKLMQQAISKQNEPEKLIDP